MKDRPVVFVVDDEPQNLRLMEAMLVPEGYEVVLAEDGPRALEMLETIDPDVCLLDVMMPGMDGYALARELRAREAARTVPIVMVTALNDVRDRVRALEAGADDFLSKPVDRSELTARVRSLVKVKAYNDHMKEYQQKLEAAVQERTRELQKANARIEAASLDTIYRLSRAAEYKDEETGGHIKRMSHYAAAVARQLGLGEATCKRILYAAPMHDVGKIGIPDRILLKPGKLDAEEWKVMKRHTLIGGAILAGSDTPHIRLARVIAMTHHEKWDGSGYPNQLAGEQIPLVGQITAIADVFDALTSRRPYKEPFSLERSYDIIRQGRGTHFAPDVVDAFFRVQEEILEIKKRFQDEDESLLVAMNAF
ncbi:response regulator [Desulfoplanes formicivorans]|uniref:Two-component system response regulator n=1 Tax=Desulfoplanes formicivorans TaxID=1592317 RepID=A0A194AII9_9BACT|nr:two-component system response regulator [Desulfoplanes formicivorans]GAU09902.1 two-component system response regulator [Desulfoplanes formicivorans]